MLRRLPCWQCCLSRFLAENSCRPFAYGSFDCGLFVADAIQAMTGTDVAARFRGTYSSFKQVRKHGSVRQIAEQVAAEFGMAEVPLLRAQRGDMALIQRPRDYSLGLVDLGGMHLAVAVKTGIVRIPLSAAWRAWRI